MYMDVRLNYKESSAPKIGDWTELNWRAVLWNKAIMYEINGKMAKTGL